MQYVLYIFALLGTALGASILYYAETESHSAIHQIAGFIVIGVAAIFLVGGAVVGAISRKPKAPPAMRRRTIRMAHVDPATLDAMERMS